MGLDTILVLIVVLVIAVILVGVERHSRRNGQQDKKENPVAKN
jgi:heme/copper-type cytochrome/quinol oxidase subunit 2